MIINRIEIENFRSYYKYNKFDLINGLNLIVGANGDGKTTFYEALDWLFRTDNANKMDAKLISKKRCDELDTGESDQVRVAMHYEHNGIDKILEKSFRFTKTLDKGITNSVYDYRLLENSGSERIVRNGICFDYDLSADIRQFVMFKGETDLDVFHKTSALKLLVDTFSDVKDFDAYFKFMKYADEKAEKATTAAQSSDRKNSAKIKEHNDTIEKEKGILSDIDKEITRKSDEAVNFEQLLKDIERSKESSGLLKNVNRRIDNLKAKRDNTASLIHEDYTINLLDDMWILMGFESVIKEYTEKIQILVDKKEKMNQDYLLEIGAEKYKEKIKTDFIPLPVNVPGYQYLQKMLDQEVCMCCNRKAPKGSESWNYIKQRLDEFLDSTKVSKDTDNIKPLFTYNFIGELQKRDTIITDNLPEISKKHHKINDVLALNNRLHNDVKKFDANIEAEYEQKKKIIAQSDGLTEEQLLSRYENISNWTNLQRDAEDRVKDLKRQRQIHSIKLEEAQNALAGLAVGTKAELYAKILKIVRHISKAFEKAKETNKTNLLQTIEDEANNFLDCLNIDDFKGAIRIIQKANDEAESVLMNLDNTRIFNPNTALKTTYLMSILFAIGKIASTKKETPFPLIFDAPTSSFTKKKESDFFNVIGKLDKQIIIVTKSFLKDNGEGEQVLDTNDIKELNGRIFRIEKKRPFDDRDLGTIQTVVTQIN